MTSIWTVRRSRTDAKLTGLCGGVAQHWGIDPVLVRLGFALLALSGGIGVVLYVAGWLLIPLAGKDSAPIEDFFGASGRRWPKEVWISLVVVATVVVFASFGSVSPFGMTPAVILAIVWYFGFYKKRGKHGHRGRPAPPEQLTPPAAPTFQYPGPPTPFTAAAESWQARMQAVAGQTPTPDPTPATESWPTAPASHPATASAYADPPAREPQPRPREVYFSLPDPVGLYTEPEPVPIAVLRRSDSPAARRLRLIALVVVGLMLAGLGIADNLGVAVPLMAYLAAPLLVLGLTLVVATWVGRARGILPVAVLLGLAVLTTAAMPAPVAAVRDWSATNLEYTKVAQLPTSGDQLDFGHLRVDLSQLALTAPATYQAQVDAGQIEIIVPADVNVLVNYRLDVGVVRMFGEEVAAGTELHSTTGGATAGDPARPTLTLDLALDVGTLVVTK